jgi:hypothetical protein
MQIERRNLAWDRQRDFHAHAHLAHRLECNGFLCDVIAASLESDEVWVSAWEPVWKAISPYWSRPPCDIARPDASFTLTTLYGLVAVALEWDRATEPMATLLQKINRYEITLREVGAQRTHNICFVVPGERRADRLLREGREAAKQVPTGRMWVTTMQRLQRHGPLSEIWRCLDHEERSYAMTDFETLDGAETTPREQALGRRWQVPMDERWAALSPLRVAAPHEEEPADALRSGEGSGLLDGQTEHDGEREEPWR